MSEKNERKTTSLILLGPEKMKIAQKIAGNFIFILFYSFIN